ncbi:chain-length determining protein [Prevotella sp.]|nr:chain-length determining protein [Prevotella sp.]
MANKKLFVILIPIVFICSCLYIVSVPRYYATETKLAPEIENAMSSSTLGSIASSFGFDMSQMNSNDAITPLLYPELLKDNSFVFKFLPISVTTQDGKIKTNYYEYLTKYNKVSPISKLFSFTQKQEEPPTKHTNPYDLTVEQDKVFTAIRDDIKFAVDSKTGVITISVKSQDPLVCKILADSVRGILQQYITSYRTNKARADVEYYKSLVTKAKANYEKARQLYGSFSDSNADVILESVRSKQNDLENDMQLKFNTYSQLNQQLQAAIAKLQEKTPAFTTLKGASVPIKPAGPKRMIFVLSMVFVAFVVGTLWTLRKDIPKLFV